MREPVRDVACRAGVRRRLCDRITAAGHAPDTVRKVVSMIDRNEYTRRQGPIGVKITPRAFGRDWRLPIVNRFREK